MVIIIQNTSQSKKIEPHKLFHTLLKSSRGCLCNDNKVPQMQKYIVEWCTLLLLLSSTFSDRLNLKLLLLLQEPFKTD